METSPMCNKRINDTAPIPLRTVLDFAQILIT